MEFLGMCLEDQLKENSVVLNNRVGGATFMEKAEGDRRKRWGPTRIIRGRGGELFSWGKG